MFHSNYGSILISFRDMTMRQTTDGRQTDNGNHIMSDRFLRWTINTIRSVAVGFGRHGMPPPASDTGTSLGQDGSDWSRDLATLIFDVGGHGACGWCGSSSSIRTPSLKFVSIAVGKIWRTMCVGINGPGDLLTLKLVCESHRRNLYSEFRHDRPSGYRVVRYIRYGRTDRRTKATLNAPFPTGRCTAGL